MKPTVHLVDASIYIFRAWFAQPPDMTNDTEIPVNAVQGFTRFLLDLLERARPTHIAVAFDESLTTSFRNTLYPQYKANRELPPLELKNQFAWCKEITAALGLCVLANSHYEADDLIGSAATTLRSHGFRAVIVSADKDFGQLIGEHDEQWDPPRNQRWSVAGIKERLGVTPEQVVDFLALTGDAVDNIPGVPGIGAKTAAALLKHFGSLETLLEKSEEVAFLRVRGAANAAARLKEHAVHARLWQTLARITLDAPVPGTPEHYGRGAFDLARIEQLFDSCRLGPLTRARVKALS